MINIMRQAHTPFYLQTDWQRERSKDTGRWQTDRRQIDRYLDKTGKQRDRLKDRHR